MAEKNKKEVDIVDDLKSFRMEISYKDSNGYADKSFVYHAFNDDNGHWTIHVRDDVTNVITEVFLHHDFLQHLVEKMKKDK